MIADETQSGLLQRLDETRRLCPDMRLGQILATIGTLGEDATGRSLWARTKSWRPRSTALPTICNAGLGTDRTHCRSNLLYFLWISRPGV